MYGRASRQPTLLTPQRLDRHISSSGSVLKPLDAVVKRPRENEDRDEIDVSKMTEEENSLNRPREELEHAVISAFDLFSIGGAFSRQCGGV